MITQSYKLNLIPNRTINCFVHVSQYDAGSRTLVFKLYNGSTEFTVPTGATAKIQGLKRDGNVFEYPMTVSGSEVSVVVEEQMAIIDGPVNCQIILEQSGKVLGTANFTLAVERSPISDGTMSESNIPPFKVLENGGEEGQHLAWKNGNAAWVDPDSEVAEEAARQAAISATTASEARTVAEEAKTAAEEAKEVATEAARTAKEEADRAFDGTPEGYEELAARNNVDDKTLTGNPLVVETMGEQYAKKAVYTLNPIQDLHGYDHPWVGGAGKNKLPLTVDRIKAANTDKAWSGNLCTVSGVSFTANTDVDGNVTGINASGTSTDVIWFWLDSSVNTYDASIINGVPNGGSYKTYGFQLTDSSDASVDGIYSATDYPKAAGSYRMRIRIASGVTLNNVLFKPMIRLATETDPTFEPYTNICPISGRTEVNVERMGGKNLLNPNKFNSFPKTVAGITYTKNNDGSFTINGTSTGTSIIDLISNFTLPKGKYILSDGWNKDGVFGTWITLWNGSTKVTQDAATTYGNGVVESILDLEQYVYDRIQLGIFIPTGKTFNNIIIRPMLRNFSISDSTFEPCQSQDISIQLGQTVYGGHADFVTGKVRVTKGFVTITGENVTGISDGSAVDSLGGKRINTNITDCMPPTGQSFVLGTSDSLIPIGDVYWTLLSNCFGSNDVGTLCLRLNGAATLEDAKTAANSMHPQIAYKLATPIELTLTPAQLSLLEGYNRITCGESGDTITVTFREGKVATVDEVYSAVDELESLIKKIVSAIAPEEISPATANHTAGSYLMMNGKLYKATQAIATGEYLTEGTNIQATTVMAELIAKTS